MKKFIGFKNGVNLGGWLSQCRFDKMHQATFIVEEDLANIKKIGCDHVRLPVDYNFVENDDGTSVDEGYKYIDLCASWCEKYGLNMILDLHKTYGYAFSDARNCGSFFEDEQYQERFLALWEKLALRYGKRSYIAFDLLNEIVDPAVKDVWNALAATAVSRIRSYAKDNWILIGGARYNHISSVKELLLPPDEKIVYSFHFYEPYIFTHQGAMWEAKMPDDFRVKYPLSANEYIEQANEKLNGNFADLFYGLEKSLSGKEMINTWFMEAVQVAEERNAPLYCGEYGVICNADSESTLNWVSDMHSIFEKNGIGRAIWAYKSMGFGITDEHCKPIFDELACCL